jgi:LMBR1 domain-containing protein 1|tara:strand:- start:9 stop:290 length:282 start_codon:yes stop_codon:yes gene_type:complete
LFNFVHQFNVNLIMLSSIAVIQFCAKAFDGYAAETSVSDIFGQEIENLRGLGSVFAENVFLYIFFAVACLSALWLGSDEVKKSRTGRRNFDSL